MKTSFLSIIGFLLLSFQCHRDDDFSYCTEEFRAVVVTITQNDTAVKLDDYYVKRMVDDHVILSLSKSTYLYANDFPEGVVIFTDDQMVMTSTEGMEFAFIGHLNGERVVDEIYHIRRDRCHIELVSGKLELYL